MPAKILFVDDDPDLELLLCGFFRRKVEADQWQLFFAHDGVEALEFLAVTPDIDAVVTDILMPRMSGLTLLTHLANIQPQMATVILSAYGDMANIRTAMNRGAFDFLTKPLDFDDLELTINKTLQHVWQQREHQRLQREQEAALRQKTQELEQALQDLQTAQFQLIQTEKLSSLGQLMAGVAHEINNPVNFIYGNLDYATKYIRDLLNVVQLYQREGFLPPEAKEKLSAIDLEFLIEDLPNLLASMKVGADRLYRLVTSLRTFSRMDEAKMQPVDIHLGIDSTLLLLQHRLKGMGDRPNIEVIKTYGTLPPVECYSIQLNQVFMNLLTNAVDALEEARITKPHITICTEICTESGLTDWVRISIGDNGAGISSEIQSRLFDPFFTTKPVGKGTGLGLSISRQIIEETHGGRLRCTSSPDRGTMFAIEIPMLQEKSGGAIAQPVSESELDEMNNTSTASH